MGTFFRSRLFLSAFMAFWLFSFLVFNRFVLVFMVIALLIYGLDLEHVTRKIVLGKGPYYIARPLLVGLAFCSYPVAFAGSHLILVATTGLSSSFFPASRGILTVIGFVALLYIALLFVVLASGVAFFFVIIIDSLRAFLSRILPNITGSTQLANAIPWRGPLVGATVLSLVTLIPLGSYIIERLKEPQNSENTTCSREPPPTRGVPLVEDLLITFDFTPNAPFEHGTYRGDDGRSHEYGVKLYTKLGFETKVSPSARGIIIAESREKWPLTIEYQGCVRGVLASRYRYLLQEDSPSNVMIDEPEK